MGIFRRLFHRHTWRTLRTVYRYKEYEGHRKIVVKKCQCRECGRIAYIHFNGKDIIY